MALRWQTIDSPNDRHLVAKRVDPGLCRLQKFYPTAINADKKRQVAVFERKLLPLQLYTSI
mgnify:CR=1 FL=1